jgi:PadR family transcriptional regulator
MTGTTREVLNALANATGETSGYTLRQATGLRSGTVYPLLARLTTNGLTAMRKETRDEWLEAGGARPIRKYYTITEEGRAFLAKHETPRTTAPAPDYVGHARGSALLDLATGHLHVTFGVPHSVQLPQIQCITARIERPDGASNETTAHVIPEGVPNGHES